MVLGSETHHIYGGRLILSLGSGRSVLHLLRRLKTPGDCSFLSITIAGFSSDPMEYEGSLLSFRCLGGGFVPDLITLLTGAVESFVFWFRRKA
ncbi:hypothetical protein DY000_02016369 [Brassica cretica]|uniref:Uncharacterized protein n=1 Tax=Brassica cretica TaxID=69181 RepID=A0ABQ7D8Q5_BRACR|nr:hypothetical protein DY000_02016369 [Brassica cretica]